MAQLNESLIEDVRRRSNIVDVVRNYLSITTKGRNHYAVCPFHDDHDPSMTISEEKQIYKCFVCGAGGNVFTFVQNYEKVSFPQAVKRVAEICNVDVDIDVGSTEKVVDDKYRILHKILNETISFTQYQLHTSVGAEVVEYLHERGIDDEWIEKFQLGYNPGENALYRFLSQKGYKDEDIIASGVARLQNNGIVDVFDERIMFPIHDMNGNPIAFSARDFSKSSSRDRAKYVNSSASELYNKSTVLYNGHRVKSVGRRLDSIYVVEGPLDVIALYRAGVTNCVATMGTAFTKEHVNGLRRLAEEVVLCYDGDDAGQNANFKAGSILKEGNVNFKIVRNTSKLDPDEIIKQLGKQELQYMLEIPQTWIEFLFNYYSKKFNLANYSEKKEFALLMMQDINSSVDEFDRLTYTERLANLTSFPQAQLLKLSVDKKEKVNKKIRVESPKKAYSKVELSELHILSQMLCSKEAAILFEDKLGSLVTSKAKALALILVNYYRTHDVAEISDMISDIQDKELTDLLTDIEGDDLFLNEYNEQLLLDNFDVIRACDIDSYIDYLMNECSKYQEPLKKAEIYKQINDLMNKKKGEIKNG